MRGFPTAMTSKSYGGWAGVTLSGWSLVIWAPMKWSPEGDETKGRSNPMKPKPLVHL
ncbi:hypothetical protein Desfe_0662 [Desulfurococcus amylolyticus DSM 16532]|uniref:Uncharacterized protein n=1 Tax=Desulfurococcus amylolyticus DSM 16532 TaxID=768672 RepID=I3XRI9_DESAM|nr:hypothetical protein Desfe_0662 [Desulfurococcus amylolyticus DSM 16532]